jgi:hypothetical protein
MTCHRVRKLHDQAMEGRKRECKISFCSVYITEIESNREEAERRKREQGREREELGRTNANEGVADTMCWRFTENGLSEERDHLGFGDVDDELELASFGRAQSTGERDGFGESGRGGVVVELSIVAA